MLLASSHCPFTSFFDLVQFGFRVAPFHPRLLLRAHLEVHSELHAGIDLVVDHMLKGLDPVGLVCLEAQEQAARLDFDA